MESEILSEEEIFESKRIINILKGGRSYDDAVAFGEKKFNELKTSVKHYDYVKPATYAVTPTVEAEKIAKLTDLNRETAVGYFAYKVDYFGKDVNGSNEKLLAYPSKAGLRMNTHYTKPQTEFDDFIVDERKKGNAMTWYYKLFGDQPSLYEPCESILIEAIPHLRSRPLRNEASGKDLTKILTNFDFKYVTDVALYLIDSFLTTTNKFNDEFLQISAVPFGCDATDDEDVQENEENSIEIARFVHLDAAAVSALNLLPKPVTSDSLPACKWQSILGVLDRCKSPQGHRLMAQWVKQPLRNEALIKDRHSIVECLVDASKARADLYENHLHQMPDILSLRKYTTLRDVYRLYQAVCHASKILSILKDLDCATVNNVLCDPIEDVLKELVKYKSDVVEILDMDSIEKGEFLLKSPSADRLEKVKTRFTELEDKMKQEHSNVIADLGLQSVKLDCLHHVGHYFRVASNEASIVYEKSYKYTVIDTLEDGVQFINDALRNLNMDFLDAADEYEKQHQLIAENLIGIAKDYFELYKRMNGCIAELDCYLSLAIAAVSAPIRYVKPKMSDISPRILNLKGMRHPCLELQEHITFIANDVDLKEDETNMYIITGSSTSGKSTYIQSVGAAVVMAHIGSFVACEEAEIPYVDSILGGFGVDDDISEKFSTFVDEIDRTATSKSLVVIDELGCGRSTEESRGIALPIAEHLAKKTKCFTLFATNFHEIINLANEVNTVKINHMSHGRSSINIGNELMDTILLEVADLLDGDMIDHSSNVVEGFQHMLLENDAQLGPDTMWECMEWSSNHDEAHGYLPKSIQYELTHKVLNIDRANLPELIAINIQNIENNMITCNSVDDIHVFMEIDGKMQINGADVVKNSPVYKPNKKELCLVRYKEGEEYVYYRCLYESDINEEQAKVYCVDYGKFLSVQANDIRAVTSDMKQEIIAMNCYIQNGTSVSVEKRVKFFGDYAKFKPLDIEYNAVENHYVINVDFSESEHENQ